MCLPGGTTVPKSKSFWKPERVQGETGQKKRPKFRTLILKVFRIKCLRNQFVFTGQ